MRCLESPVLQVEKNVTSFFLEANAAVNYPQRKLVEDNQVKPHQGYLQQFMFIPDSIYWPLVVPGFQGSSLSSQIGTCPCLQFIMHKTKKIYGHQMRRWNVPVADRDRNFIYFIRQNMSFKCLVLTWRIMPFD